MTTLPLLVGLFLAAYLLGAVPFGLLVARFKGVDIRRHGSGNIGATNVGRILGRKWGVLVFLLDAVKGLATTALTPSILSLYPAQLSITQQDYILLGSALCCVLGNIAPVYLKFKGGKGVATSLGVILGIYPYLTCPGLIVGLVWVSVVAISRYISLGSIVAAILLPAVFVMLARFSNWSLADHYPLLGLSVVLALAVLVRHRSNVARLRAGTENKIGSRPKG